jgi:hypothetical protein
MLRSAARDAPMESGPLPGVEIPRRGASVEAELVRKPLEGSRRGE